MMTTTEEREAGEALNAEIATRVMGWRDVYVEPGGKKLRGKAGRPAPFGVYGTQCEVPKYSANISAAFLVVEEMRERGYRPLVNVGAAPGDWHCSFAIGDEYTHAYGDTASLAICRAALFAIEAATAQPASTPSSVVEGVHP